MNILEKLAVGIENENFGKIGSGNREDRGIFQKQEKKVVYAKKNFVWTKCTTLTAENHSHCS